MSKRDFWFIFVFFYLPVQSPVFVCLPRVIVKGQPHKQAVIKVLKEDDATWHELPSRDTVIDEQRVSKLLPHFLRFPPSDPSSLPPILHSSILPSILTPTHPSSPPHPPFPSTPTLPPPFLHPSSTIH